MLLNPPLLFLLHPARTVLQTFPRAPFISIHSRIFRGSDAPPRLSLVSRCVELVLYWGEGNTGSLQLCLPPHTLHMGGG